jgi:hypothetical protein
MQQLVNALAQARLRAAGIAAGNFATASGSDFTTTSSASAGLDVIATTKSVEQLESIGVRADQRDQTNRQDGKNRSCLHQEGSFDPNNNLENTAYQPDRFGPSTNLGG